MLLSDKNRTFIFFNTLFFLIKHGIAYTRLWKQTYKKKAPSFEDLSTFPLWLEGTLKTTQFHTPVIDRMLRTRSDCPGPQPTCP